MGHNFGLKPTAVLGNEFEVQMDNQGKFRATDSFTGPFNAIQPLLPALGAPCPRAGWTFLFVEGWKIEPQHGNACKVVIEYTGSSNQGAGGGGDFNYDNASPNELTYELAITASEEPLETHYRYRSDDESPPGPIPKKEKELINDIKTGLYERVNADDPDSPDYYKFSHVHDPNKPTREITTAQGKELINYLLRGVLSYLHARQIWRERWTDSKLPSATILNRVGKIYNPKAAPTLNNGRNWLFTGLNVTQEGKIFTNVAEYELSGLGGWDPHFYQQIP